MDALVARYSRPAYQQNELFSEEEQQDLCETQPPLSLKFSMPPVAHVRLPNHHPPSSQCPSKYPSGPFLLLFALSQLASQTRFDDGAMTTTMMMMNDDSNKKLTTVTKPALLLAPRRNRRPRQPFVPHQDCPRHHHTGLPFPRRHRGGDGLARHGG